MLAPNARLGPMRRAPFGPKRNQPRRSEDAVLSLFIYLYELLEKALDRAEHSRRDAYLASAVDIGELERRMHTMEI
jgi:Protein of unknown function (DUF3563)